MIEREGSVELDSSTDHVPAVPHERLVVSVPVDGMLKLPAIATEVFEAGQVPVTIMLIGYQHSLMKQRGVYYLRTLGEAEKIKTNA